MYSSLRVLKPPTDEPVPIEVARRHCRIDADYDDELLLMYVTSARQWAESWLNRALMPQTLRYQYSASPPPTATPLVPQSLIVFPLNFPPMTRRAIELPRAPVSAVTSIMWGEPDDMKPADPSEYMLNLLIEPAQVQIKPQLIPILPQQNLQIDYEAGYACADDIPAGIKHGILILTAFLYEQRGDVTADMPEAATLLMGMHRLWTFSG